MGCVLGTRATGDGSRQKSSRNDNSSALDVKTKKKENIKSSEKSDGALQATEKLRPLSEFRKRAGQAWPSWLTDVAGDAIKDWTPRRANTFEKLDKVLFCCYIIVKIILQFLEVRNNCSDVFSGLNSHIKFDDDMF